MKKILLFILAFFLIPFYPFLKRIRKFGEKIRIGEKIVVVTREGQKRKVSIT